MNLVTQSFMLRGLDTHIDLPSDARAFSLTPFEIYISSFAVK